MSKARNLSAFISDPAIDASEIGSNAVTTDKLSDLSVTHAKLHTNMDLTGKTVTFADNHISGNKIHGGVISDFASIGIDDNASSTAITIFNSGNVGVGTNSPGNKLTVSAQSGGTVFELNRSNTNTTGTVGAIAFTASDNHVVSAINAVGNGTDNGSHLQFRTTSNASGTNYYGDTNVRMTIHSAGDVLIGTESGIGVGAKLNVLSSGGNVLHVQSSNSNANNIVSHNSSGQQAFTVANNGEVYSAGRLRGDSIVTHGVGIGKGFGTSWTTLFTIPSNTNKSVWAKIRAFNTENGATSHYTFYFSAVIRHNGTPYGDFYNFSYTADANLQNASGSSFAQFRFTNNGVTNGDLYFQGYNTTYGNTIYFYEINAYGYSHIVW